MPQAREKLPVLPARAGNGGDEVSVSPPAIGEGDGPAAAEEPASPPQSVPRAPALPRPLRQHRELREASPCDRHSREALASVGPLPAPSLRAANQPRCVFLPRDEQEMGFRPSFLQQPVRPLAVSSHGHGPERARSRSGAPTGGRLRHRLVGSIDPEVSPRPLPRCHSALGRHDVPLSPTSPHGEQILPRPQAPAWRQQLPPEPSCPPGLGNLFKALSLLLSPRRGPSSQFLKSLWRNPCAAVAGGRTSSWDLLLPPPGARHP